MAVELETRRLVRQRAGQCCECCQLPERSSPVARLQIEHVVPRKHGGSDDLSNLALACLDCNLRKGSNLTGIDPQTGVVTALFNPRTGRWIDHFVRRGMHLVGITAVGRTTIRVMGLNSEDRIQLRLALQG